MNTEEPRVSKALNLIDAGASVAEAAKEIGISAQAIYEALKVRKLQQTRADRTCSECGAILPATARKGVTTCSVKCRVARSRRLTKEAEAILREKINRERAALGLPTI